MEFFRKKKERGLKNKKENKKFFLNNEIKYAQIARHS
jgi:hypothetical protein